MPDRLTRLFIRHSLWCIAVPIVLAFVVSSPGDAGFWVVLAGAVLVMVPTMAVLFWAWGDTRRLKRSPLDSD